MKHTKMKELPHEERPYERCVKSGPEYLSDAQLLAVILRTGSTQESVLELAGRILELGGPGEGILGLLHLSLPELMSVKGIGQVKAILTSRPRWQNTIRKICVIRNRKSST